MICRRLLSLLLIFSLLNALLPTGRVFAAVHPQAVRPVAALTAQALEVRSGSFPRTAAVFAAAAVLFFSACVPVHRGTTVNRPARAPAAVQESDPDRFRRILNELPIDKKITRRKFPDKDYYKVLTEMRSYSEFVLQFLVSYYPKSTPQQRDDINFIANKIDAAAWHALLEEKGFLELPVVPSVPRDKELQRRPPKAPEEESRTTRLWLPFGLSLGILGGAMAAGGPRTILVVDDEELPRSSIAGALQDEGYHVVTAENSTEAESILSRLSGDALVIVDDAMPDYGDGEVLIGRLRNQYPGLPILFMSGSFTTAVRGRMEKYSPPIPLLDKPFTMKTLIGHVKAAMPHEIHRENAEPRRFAEEALAPGVSPASGPCARVIERTRTVARV